MKKMPRKEAYVLLFPALYVSLEIAHYIYAT